MVSLRKRIADSPRFNRAVEGFFAAYLRFAVRTSQWDRIGFEEMENELRGGGTVIFTLWHQRLIMAPYMFDTNLGKFCSLTSSARAGRMVGQVLGRFGFATIPMSSHKRHVALSREVLRKMQDGYSIGIAVDGPRGPARVASTVPLVWARSTGRPVYVLSFSARRVIKLPTWDRAMLPMPFTRGVLTCARWDKEVPRKSSADQTEALRQNLENALNAITDAGDAAIDQGRRA